MLLQNTFLVFALFVISKCEVESVCSEIQTFENGLPSSVKEFGPNDYLGAVMTAWHKPFTRLVKFFPEYFTSSMCEPILLKVGGVKIKISFRPRGCCSHCCLIDKVEDYLTMYFFSKNNPVRHVRLSSKRKAGKLASLGFNNQSKTILHLHGFGEDGGLEAGRSVLQIPEAYLRKKENFNVLTLDYSELSLIPWYHEAVDNLKLIAKEVAKFIIFYDKTGELNIENFHIMGISLGAQLGSHIAKQLGKYKKVGRVSGFDPAFGLYKEADVLENLSTEDAHFVDIIHTTSGIFGTRKPSGHADFYFSYPPETLLRPACDLLKLSDRGEFVDYFICDHLRAVRIYIQTVSQPHLIPVCQNVTLNSNASSQVCGYLGFAANKSTTFGVYHLTTRLDWDPWELLENVD